MKSVCVIDTSIFDEILNVPDVANQHEAIIGELENRLNQDEGLFLPMATILETGNHIAQHGDGRRRRKCAEEFVEQVQLALDRKSPFTPVRFPGADAMRQWLTGFPDSAMAGVGLCDVSIVHDWEWLCDRNSARRVYIWSLDDHLKSYDRGPTI